MKSTLTIDKQSGIPKYLQFMDLLKKTVLEENYREGDRFPTERELMKKYNLSSATVSRAMKELVDEGVFVRKVGGGTFVRSVTLKQAPYTFMPMPTLTVVFTDIPPIKSKNPLHWFIGQEIFRGIANNYNGSLSFINRYELKAGIEDIKGKIILINPVSEDIEVVKKRQLQYVIIAQLHQYEGFSNAVRGDKIFGTFELMKYLIQTLGHTRIGIITGKSRTHAERYGGYQIALRSHGIEFDESLVTFEENGFEENGFQAMKKLLSLENPPTAVFADTDIKALGAIQCAIKTGLRVPEDISIAGFDDIPGIEEYSPALTTVKAPYYQMGTAAVKLLSRGEKELQDGIILNSKLIVRNSCGPCPIRTNEERNHGRK
jgi:DNA-binding transcriptional regulator YhcF (GntR family)